MKSKTALSIILVLLLIAYFKLTDFNNKPVTYIDRPTTIIEKDSSDYIFHKSKKL